jgi:hypothetical protein
MLLMYLIKLLLESANPNATFRQKVPRAVAVRFLIVKTSRATRCLPWF